jgi:hypothetical protein
MIHFHFGSLAAVKHANNTDYWIVTPHDSSDIYFSIHISKLMAWIGS